MVWFMPQDAQAQADLETTQTGEDLETDAAHDPIDGATNLKDYEALLEESLKPQADAVDEEELDPEEAEEDAGNGEEPETEEAEEAPEEESIPEDTVEEDEGKPQERFRIRATNEVEATALLLKKQNPGWTLEDCLSKSKTIHGTPEDTAYAPADKEEGPKTVTEVRARINALRDAKAEAFEALEFTEASRLDREIDTLRDALDEIKEQEVRNEQLLEMEFNQAVEHSQNKAVAIYPDVTQAASPLVKRMVEIDRQMKEDGNPLYFSPDKPYKLAQMAANDIGIAPRNPKSATNPARPMAKSRTVQPASGNARTTAPTSPTDKIEQAVDQVDDIASYDALLAKIAS
jgi:hypothetical protein